MFYQPENRDRELLPHDPLKAIVAPRPIGWISTLGKDGVANLSPYSFFNSVSGMPPLLMFSSVGLKDSARNASDTGEFVFNYVGQNTDKAMNESSVPCPPQVDEFEYLGLEKASCELVAAPRVAAAHAALECKVTEIIEPTDIDGNKTEMVMVIGQVVGVHIDPNVIRDGRFDVSLAQPVTRLGYLDFGTLGEMYEQVRPSWEGKTHNP